MSLKFSQVAALIFPLTADPEVGMTVYIVDHLTTTTTGSTGPTIMSWRKFSDFSLILSGYKTSEIF